MMLNADIARDNADTAVSNAQGRRLAMARAAQGMTQAEFAARLGFHKRSYIAWEQGYREIPGRALMRLRQAFNVDPVYILEGPDGPPRAYTSILDPALLAQAHEMVTKGIRQTDLAPNKAETMALVTEIYRLLIETPREAERLLALALNLGGRGSK